MDIPYYEFVTSWEMPAPPEMLYDLLADPSRYTSWMKRFSVQVRPVSPGNGEGIGREDIYEVRAFLPYSLRWKLKCVQARRPHEFLSEASGDLAGTGRWSFCKNTSGTLVVFEWKVAANKPFLRRFTWLLRPVFQWNHDWVMKRWERDLREEVERLKTEDQSY